MEKQAFAETLVPEPSHTFEERKAAGSWPGGNAALRTLSTCAPLLLAVLIGLGEAERALAGPVTAYILSATSITDVVGTHTGQVSALATKDQTGTQNDPSKYVQFGLPSGQLYLGYRSYFLPTSVAPSTVTTITLIANVLAPSSASDQWAWSTFNWSTNSWEKLGNQNNCGGTTGLHTCSADSQSFAGWKWLQYNALGTRSNYINSSTGEIRIQLASSNSSSFVDVDYETVAVYSNNGVVGALFQPATNSRWQYQLQANANTFPATNGINVDICVVPFTGGACVQPAVFDIDLYVDATITGSDDFEFDTAAVQSIHGSGRHVIGYITAGDVETFRADFQQFVDFDNACNGCLIGKPFSSTFKNEYWANINNDKGQADFMRKMVRARTDKVATAGFDAIEYDVVCTYQNGSNITGFTVSYATQLAYNQSVAAIAHADGLSAPLKNDSTQIPDLVSSFDFAINEQCFQFSECGNYTPFRNAGKAVLEVEYRLDPSKFCSQANSMNFNSIKKARDFSLFDTPWTPCR